MSEKDKQRFIYIFDPERPELVTDPDAWTEEDTRTAHDHFAYLKGAIEEDTVILAGRSADELGQPSQSWMHPQNPRRATSWSMTRSWRRFDASLVASVPGSAGA